MQNSELIAQLEEIKFKRPKSGFIIPKELLEETIKALKQNDRNETVSR